MCVVTNIVDFEALSLQFVWKCLDSRPRPCLPEMPTVLGNTSVVCHYEREFYWISSIGLFGGPRVQATCKYGDVNEDAKTLSAVCIIEIHELEAGVVRLEFDCKLEDGRLDVLQREDNYASQDRFG
jgi:hypothetical protein